VSTAEKAGVVARVATRQVKRSRTVRAVTGAVSTTARAMGRVLHQLWLEVIGVVFLIMALSFGGATVKEYGQYRGGHAELWHPVIAICCTVVFAWFGLSSFWRVKRKGKGGAR
jgi:hypothetical protein